MHCNIEIKASIANIDEIESKAAEIADQGPIVIKQEDTFFTCRNGYLKVRKFSNTEGELIYYRRSEDPGPKQCAYLISKTKEPDIVRKILSHALSIIGTVKKARTLYTIGRTRIHLDEVEGLGRFIEFEYVLAPDQDEKEGRAYIVSLMERLGIAEGDLIDKPYVGFS